MFKRIAIAAAVIIGLIVAGMVLMRREEARVATLTAEAPAEVTAVSVRTDQDSSTDTTVVDYRFTAAGEVMTAQSTKQGNLRDDFAKGSTVKACYDPAQPTESEVFPAGHACAGGQAAAPASPAPSGEMSATDMDMAMPD